MKRISALTIIASSILISGFGSCSRSLDTACNGYFPRIKEDLASARIELASDRALASDSDRTEWKDHWMEWSLDRLKETQKFIDSAEEDPAHAMLRKELTGAANKLVEFYGHAKQARSREMISSLEKVEAHGEKARGLACTPSR
jgi:hypothetical protein